MQTQTSMKVTSPVNSQLQVTKPSKIEDLNRMYTERDYFVKNPEKILASRRTLAHLDGPSDAIQKKPEKTEEEEGAKKVMSARL